MSTRELNRLRVLVRVTEKRLTQREAAEQLGVTARHHTCAIRATTGEVVCWGNDAYGQSSVPDAMQ